MRLPATGNTDSGSGHGAAAGRAVGSGITAGISRPIAVDRTGAIGSRVRTNCGMIVRRQLSGSQRNRFAPAQLTDHSRTEAGSGTLMQRDTAGQREIRYAVAARLFR